MNNGGTADMAAKAQGWGLTVLVVPWEVAG